MATDRDISAIASWEHGEDGRDFGGVRRREPPAVCYTCGADVEDGPRFGAEATCDACRRDPPLIPVCAWCETSKAQTAALHAMGYETTHTICADCAAAFREGR